MWGDTYPGFESRPLRHKNRPSQSDDRPPKLIKGDSGFTVPAFYCHRSSVDGHRSTVVKESLAVLDGELAVPCTRNPL